MLNSFEKYAKIIHFSSFFDENFKKIFSKFPNNLCFSSKREKLTHGLLKFFLKNAKIMHFSQFSEEGFSKFSQQISIPIGF